MRVTTCQLNTDQTNNEQEKCIQRKNKIGNEKINQKSTTKNKSRTIQNEKKTILYEYM